MTSSYLKSILTSPFLPSVKMGWDVLIEASPQTTFSFSKVFEAEPQASHPHFLCRRHKKWGNIFNNLELLFSNA